MQVYIQLLCDHWIAQYTCWTKMSNCFRYPCILLSEMSNCFIYLIIHGQTPPRGWPGAYRRARAARLLAVLPALPVARPLDSPMVVAWKLRGCAASPGKEPTVQPARQREGGLLILFCWILWFTYSWFVYLDSYTMKYILCSFVELI